MLVLVAIVTYMLHLVALPLGWVQTNSTAGLTVSPRTNVAIARDGTIAVLLATPSNNDGGGSGALLVVHPSGRSVMLRSTSIDGPPQFLRKFAPPIRGHDRDIWFTNVAVADDGTPFVTAYYGFSGAVGGDVYGAFVWNGAWHYVPSVNPFAGLGLPSEPRNVSIAAAESIEDFAYMGNHSDTYPGEDLNIAARDPKLLDLSAVSFDSRRIGLGLGTATAMRGSFVAGFDAGRGLVANAAADPPAAVLWRCSGSRRSSASRCKRSNLWTGAAYGVDSSGEAVGSAFPNIQESSCNPSAGPAMLWRDGKAVELTVGAGAAYAISERGTIVGTMGDTCRPRFERGFVADARASMPRARPLDDLVTNLAGRNVVAAFGIDDDGRILCFVAGAQRKRYLALLVPR